MQEQVTVASNILSIRPHEYLTFHPERTVRPADNGTLYAVALLKTPPFPGERSSSRNLALVCAAYRDGQWQWVHLERESKRIIYTHLRKHRAFLGRWYFMELTPS